MGRRPTLVTAAAAIAAVFFVAPAAAQAATYTVKPGNGPCGAPADLICGNLVEATTAANDGDTFNVTASTTPYDAVEFKKEAVTINGEPGVGINGTMKFTAAAGAPSKLTKVALAQGTAAAPGIIVSGAGGLELVDSIIASTDGNAILITAGEANKIVRSVIITGGASASAVRIESLTGTPNKGLTLESTLLTGGAAGISVRTQNNLLESPAGDVNIVARHITAAGSANGINLDSSNAASPLLGGPAGNIVVTLSDSIALNNITKRYTLLTANTAAINADTHSLQTADQAAVFAAPTSHNYRLRPGSTAIDKGGFTAGESEFDIDGDPRPGPTTDLGADEFVNAPPTAAIKVATSPARAGQPVTFDAGGSRDRESNYGGGIVKYQWNFGDGTSQETTAPTVQHTYPAEGTAVVGVVVIDNFGAASPAATASVTLIDGTPPDVRITKPFRNQKIKLTKVTRKTVTDESGKKKTTTTRKKTKIAFAGTAKDASGVANVVLFIEKLAAEESSGTTAKAAQARTGKCTWLDPKRGLIRRSCNKPVFILAKLNADGTWAYNVSTKIKQPSPGSYRVIATGIDKTGAAGNAAGSKDGISFFKLIK